MVKSDLKYLPELLTRFLIYRLQFKTVFKHILKKKTTVKTSKLSLSQIEAAISSLGIAKGDTVMVHSSMSNIDCSAHELVSFLKNYIGSGGNILMPTHPKLTVENGMLIYDVENSPSTVGYLTEVFRKSEGVSRSLHPFSSVAVWGKDKDYYLKDNLYEDALPHGFNSPYQKFSLQKGKAVLLGVLNNRATIRHVAEELADDSLPIKNFFSHFNVKIVDGDIAEVFNVRKADLKKSQLYISRKKVNDLWNQHHLIQHFNVSSVPCSVVDAEGVVNYQLKEIQAGSTQYPFAPKKKI